MFSFEGFAQDIGMGFTLFELHSPLGLSVNMLNFYIYIYIWEIPSTCTYKYNYFPFISANDYTSTYKWIYFKSVRIWINITLCVYVVGRILNSPIIFYWKFLSKLFFIFIMYIFYLIIKEVYFNIFIIFSILKLIKDI